MAGARGPARRDARRRGARVRSAKAVLEDGPIRRERVADEGDFFALFEAAGHVVDGHLERVIAVSNELAHKLDVEIEAVARELEALEALRAEDLEHRVD